MVAYELICGLLSNILMYLGVVFVVVGGVFEIIGVLGILRMPSFYLRAHSATMTVVGGTLTPLTGLAMISISRDGLGGLHFTAICMVVVVLILVTAPTGIHALVRASLLGESRGVGDWRREDVVRGG